MAFYSSILNLAKFTLHHSLFTIHPDDCFDCAEVWVGELGEFFRDFFEGNAVGDPEIGVDFALSDEIDDFWEIGGQCVA